MTNNQIQILELEYQKKKHIFDYLQKKLDRYKKANSKINNVISEDEIEEVVVEIKNAELEMQILKAKIDGLTDVS